MGVATLDPSYGAWSSYSQPGHLTASVPVSFTFSFNLPSAGQVVDLEARPFNCLRPR